MVSGIARPLQDTDITAVAALRGRCFRHARHRDPESVAALFSAVFLDNPWKDTGVQSLVYEAADGRILGFRGLVGRPMRFRGQALLAAVSSQFMVDPDARTEGVALALMRESLKGPQELTFADLANPGAARLWKLARGVDVPELALQWHRPLRPMQWMADRVGRDRRLRWPLRFIRPVLAGIDHLAARNAQGPFGTSARPHVEAISESGYATLLSELGNRYDLVPDCTPAALSWTLERLRLGLEPGHRLVLAQVRDGRGEVAGFFAAVVGGNRAGVLQMGASGNTADLVLGGIVAHAAGERCQVVSGRLQPEFTDVLARMPGMLSVGDPRCLVIAHRPELVDCIRKGKAWLTRLEGESWMGF